MTFDLETPNSIGVMTNHHTKLEGSWMMSSLVNDRKRFVYGLTDRPTERAKQYTPHFLEGGGIKNLLLTSDILYSLIC